MESVWKTCRLNKIDPENLRFGSTLCQKITCYIFLTSNTQSIFTLLITQYYFRFGYVTIYLTDPKIHL